MEGTLLRLVQQAPVQQTPGTAAAVAVTATVESTAPKAAAAAATADDKFVKVIERGVP
jgi:hypothetical protein